MAVWERADEEYVTQVAIKLVRRDMDTAVILKRFYRERQTLARMQHPHIARLLDGGTTPDGDPYIVMEYVEGRRLTDYCQEEKLGLRQRLELFLAVCEAVEYAHRNFVVHRDLKPGNILVDGTGAVKLLDFGICKLLHQAEAGGGETVGQMPAYTPDYASPEQIRAEPVTLATDVYSAGAVLYELLTGVKAHRIADYSARGIEKAICEAEIVRASEAGRGQAWGRQLAGDLDNIVGQALQKEPERRYGTMEHFAEDLRRYLRDEPVRARPSSLGYRARKFVKRRRGWVAATAAVLLTLGGGMAVAWREARVAQENLGMVRQLSNTFVFDVYDAVNELPGATKARELIVKTGLEYLDNLSRNAGGDTELQLELAGAYKRIGDVQGYVMQANLGRTDDALRSYEKAVRLLREAGRRGSLARKARLEEVRVQRRIAAVYEYTRKVEEALGQFAETTRLARRLKDEDPSDFRAAVLWGGVQLAEGAMVQRMGKYREARELYEMVMGELEGLAKRWPGDSELEGNLAVAISRRAMCDIRLGRLKDAVEAYRKGIVWRQRELEKDPSNVRFQRNLMFEYSHLGDVLGNPNLPNLGDRAGAAEAFGKMMKLARDIYEADRNDQRAQSDFAIAQMRVAAVWPEKEYAERIRLLRQSQVLHEQIARANPKNLLNRADQVYAHHFLGDALKESGDKAGALKEYEAGAKLGESLLGGTNAAMPAVTALVYRKLGQLRGERGEREAALRCGRRVVELTAGKEGKAPRTEAQRLFEVRGSTAMGLIHAALAGSRARAAGDVGEAKRWLEQSLRAYADLEKLPSFSSTHRREVVMIREALEKLR